MYSIPSMSMSTVQQRDPDNIHLLLLAFSFILFYVLCPKWLDTVPCSLRRDRLACPYAQCYSWHLRTPSSLSIPFSPTPPWQPLFCSPCLWVSSVFSPACHLLSPHLRARYLLAPGCFIPIKSIQADMRYTVGPVSCWSSQCITLALLPSGAKWRHGLTVHKVFFLKKTKCTRRKSVIVQSWYAPVSVRTESKMVFLFLMKEELL